LDREFIVKTIFGKFSPIAEGPLSHELFEYTTGVGYPSYNPEYASEIMDELGWILDATSQQRHKDDKSLDLRVVVPPWGSNPEVGQLISAAWEKLGIEVILEIAPGFGPLKQAQESGEYNLIGINFFGTDPDLLSSFYSGDGFYNWSGYQNSELDSLLMDAIRVTHDHQRRQAYYSEISEIIRDELLLIPIRDYVNLVVARSNLQGLRFSPQGWFPYLIDLRRAP
jgi:ABC-type transport system substrate-binding protein